MGIVDSISPSSYLAPCTLAIGSRAYRSTDKERMRGTLSECGQEEKSESWQVGKGFIEEVGLVLLFGNTQDLGVQGIWESR